MARTLGLDLGTSSIGWAIVEGNRKPKLINKGVIVFQKGVGEDAKNNEFSLAAERTGYRSARRLKQRRRLRKIQTLRVLSEHGLCPSLDNEALRQWQRKKIYPEDAAFRAWLRTREGAQDIREKHPYYCRNEAATRKLDLDSEQDRLLLGRAFYHIAQRRGYKSNRRANADENSNAGKQGKDGAVSKEISRLRTAMRGRTLGQYFYEDIYGKEPVRGHGHYTSREDYEDEFEIICARQELEPYLRARLKRAIFWQRPLKSQRGAVGKCVFEPRKSRVSISHPLYERFCVLQFVNSVKVRGPQESALRELNAQEHEVAVTWMLKKERGERFEKLAKTIAPKKASIIYGTGGQSAPALSWVFTHRKDTVLPACPFTARMIKVFGPNWQKDAAASYKKRKLKSQQQAIADIWHTIASFDDRKKLNALLVQTFGINEKQADILSAPLREGHGALSLKAIKRILPQLERGLLYSHAVLLANVPHILKKYAVDNIISISTVEKDVDEIFASQHMRIVAMRAVRSFLKTMSDDDLGVGLSMLDRKEKATEAIEAELCHGAAEEWARMSQEEHRSLLDECLRALEAGINEAKRERNRGSKIGRAAVSAATTHERIAKSLVRRIARHTEKDTDSLLNEISQMLYHPSALEAYPQSENRRLGSPIIASIKNPVFYRTMHQLRHLINDLLEEGQIDEDTRIRIEMARDLNDANQRAAIRRRQRVREKQRGDYMEKIREYGLEPTDTLLLKYQLWQEQEHRCIYTNSEIGVEQLLAEDPEFDIEHTVPRSRRLDDSQENKTLCCRLFNREKKGRLLPSELPDAESIFERARRCYEPHIIRAEMIMAKRRAESRVAREKKKADLARERYLEARKECAYWRGKLQRFKIEEPPSGFTNNQLVDTRIICKYARSYLKTVFPRVYSLRAGAVSMGKTIWGLNKKERDNHVHHCVDAVTTACISPSFYSELAQYFHNDEQHRWHGASRPTTPEPWIGFSRYMNERLWDEVLVCHHSRDNVFKQSRCYLRKRGRIRRSGDGQPLVATGRTVRGELHRETIYGKIQSPVSNAGKLTSVVRKRITDLKKSDVEKIIDPRVRGTVSEHFGDIGERPLWLNREKEIEIKKVRLRAHPNPKNLVDVGEHRDKSDKPYKQNRWAQTSNNYALLVYRGQINGRSKSSNRLMSVFEAVQRHSASPKESFFPDVDDDGLRLTYVYKTGTCVILLQPGEGCTDVSKMGTVALSRRLYNVTKMTDGRITLVHHCAAQRAKDLGQGVSRVDWETDTPEKRLYVSVNKFDCLVDGRDFVLTRTGQVVWPEE